MANKLTIIGEFNAEGVLQGLTTASNAVEEHAKKMQASFSGFDAAIDQEREAWDGLTPHIQNVGDTTVEIGKRIDFSSMEARHSVMLLGEEFGVHVPRAVATLLASIGPLGTLLAEAFPLLGAIALLGVLAKLIESHEQYKEKIEEIAEKNQELSIKEQDRVEQIELSTLKIRDQIDLIEGRPASNKLSEALLDAKIKADELAASLVNDVIRSQQFLAGQNNLIESVSRNWDILQNSLKSGSITRILTTKDKDAATDAVNAVNVKIHELIEAQKEQAEVAPGDQSKLSDAMQKTAQAGKNLHDTASASAETFKTLGLNGTEAFEKIDGVAVRGISVFNSLTAQIENNKAAVQRDSEEMVQAAARLADEVARPKIQGKEKLALLDVEGDKQRAAAELELAQDTYKKTVEMAVQAGKDRAAAEQDALPVLEAAEKKFADSQVSIAQREHDAKVAAINAEISLVTNSKAKQGAEQKAQLETLNNSLLEENKRYENERAKLASDAEKKITDDQLREIQIRAKAEQEALQREIEQIHERTEAAKAQAQSGVETVKTGTPTQAGSEEQIEAINQKYREGIITFREYRAEKAAALNAEKAELDAVFAKEKEVLDAEAQRLKAEIDSGKLEGEALREAEKEYANLKVRIQEVENEQAKMTGQVQKELTQLSNEVNKYSLSWDQFFKKFANESGSTMDQFRTATQQAFTQLDKGIASSFAQWVVYGKSFAKSMQKVYAQILTDLIQTLAQMLERWIITHTIMALFAKKTGTDDSGAQAQARAQQVIAADRGQAQADVFLQAIENVPFPANLGVAPAASAAVGAMMGAFAASSGAGFSEGGAVRSMDSGGHIKGPGSSTSDSIPARLSDGEYVVKTSSVDHYGVAMLDAINNKQFSKGGYVIEYAHGGPVGSNPFVPAFAAGGVVAPIGGMSVIRRAEGGMISHSVSTVNKGGHTFNMGGVAIHNHTDGSRMTEVELSKMFKKAARRGMVDVSE